MSNLQKQLSALIDFYRNTEDIMKLLITISFLILIFSAFAQKKVNPILKCLALEEEHFHKTKTQNARSRLNLELLNEFAQASELELKDEFIKQICSNPSISPSERFLELQLLNGINVYDLGVAGKDHSMRVALISEFQKQLPQLLIKYLGSIQSELEIPNCLEREFPEIKKINERIKYLEEDFAVETLKPLHPEIKKIFAGIRDLKSLKAKCKKPKI